MSSPDLNESNQIEIKAGFVAGTLVHTQEGLRPIEEIKVGDYVLSKPESGEGELAYKRVTRTYAFDDKEIWYLRFFDANNNDHALTGGVCGTGDHPFWLEGFDKERTAAHSNEEGIFAQTWIHLQNIKRGMILQLADKRRVIADYPCRLISMRYPEFAWFNYSNGNQPYYYGEVLNFNETPPQLCRGDITNMSGELILHAFDPNSPRDYLNEGEEWEGISEVKWFKRKVYNLEVEEYHTCFVTKQGVWVNNANYDVSAKLA